jgi:hypothetical protein
MQKAMRSLILSVRNYWGGYCSKESTKAFSNGLHQEESRLAVNLYMEEPVFSCSMPFKRKD